MWYPYFDLPFHKYIYYVKLFYLTGFDSPAVTLGRLPASWMEMFWAPGPCTLITSMGFLNESPSVVILVNCSD